ncbi:MAG: carbohydrate ABC transporter permease [Bosea sp.]|nr:carbohydrate ABC transporter permease [Bosea sp. (in: a-proteobacteria)]
MKRLTQPKALAFEVLRHMLLLLGAAFMLFPFVVMVSTSLKPAGEIFSPGFSLLPQTWAAVENYTTAFTRIPLGRFILNGVFVGAAIFFFQALIAVPCAYALAKLRFRGRETIFVFVLLGLLIPPQAPAIPLYIAMWQLGLIDTYAALIIPSSISVFGIFLMRQFFRQVPDDLIHAARIDGLNEFAIVWRIMVPSAMPALIAFAVLSLVWNWNEYFWPLIAIQSTHLMTPPLGIAFFDNAEAGTNYGPLMAAAVAVTAPLVIAFLVAQRRFLEGFAVTGVK